MVYQLGTYRIPAPILFAGTAYDGDEWWYIQLVRRTGQFSYEGYIAETRDELRTTTTMREVSCEQLSHAEFIGANKPFSYYVAPADALPWSLRAHFSAAGLFYFHLTGPREDDLQPVRIVALPERLSNPETRSFEYELDDDSLRQAVLLTRELLRLPTGELRDLVEQFAASRNAVQPIHSAPVAAHTSAKAEIKMFAELQLLPECIREALISAYQRKQMLDHQQEEDAMGSASARGKLSVEELEGLLITQMDDPLYCILHSRKPVESADLIEEEDEIKPVFVPLSMMKTVCKKYQEEVKLLVKLTLTLQRKLVLRSALWELRRQMKRRNLKSDDRQKLQEQDWALRNALANEERSSYDRVQILPVAASATRIKGFHVHLYRQMDAERPAA